MFLAPKLILIFYSNNEKIQVLPIFTFPREAQKDTICRHQNWDFKPGTCLPEY